MFEFAKSIKDWLRGEDCWAGTTIDKDIDPQFIAKNLPYQDFENEMFLNMDRTIGRLWECMPTTAANSSDAKTKILEGLGRLLLPEGSVVQFILHADDRIDDIIDKICPVKNGDRQTGLHALNATYREFLSNGRDGLYGNNGIPVRNFRLYVSLKVPKYQAKDIFEKYQAEDVFEDFQQILQSAGFAPRQMNVSEIEAIVAGVLNISSPGSLFRKIMPPDTIVKKKKRSPDLSIMGRHYRCMTVKSFPPSLDLFQTSELFGGERGIICDTDQVKTPFIYCFNIITRPLPSKLLNNRIKTEQEVGTPFLEVLPIFWTWSNSEQKASDSLLLAKRNCEMQGYVCQEEKKGLPALLISALPFGLYNIGSNIDSISRSHLLSSSSVAKGLPVYGDFAGGGRKPGLPFLGRKGQLGNIDLFTSDWNANTLVTGHAGSGKTFLLKQMVTNYMSVGAPVRVMDMGGAWKQMANVLDGSFNTLDPQKPFSLNPFTTIEHPESDLEPVYEMVVEMVLNNSENDPELCEDIELLGSIASWAARVAWRLKGNLADFNDIYLALLNLNRDGVVPVHKGKDADSICKTARRMCAVLSDYTSSGKFGGWFTGPCAIDLSAQISVIDMELLIPVPPLFNILTLRVFNEINRWDVHSECVRTPHLALINESWTFLQRRKDGHHRVFGLSTVERCLRKNRRINAATIFDFQSVLDLGCLGRLGETIRNNSAFKFHLQSHDFERAAYEKLLDSTPFEIHLMKSVSINRPKYTEAFVDSPYGVGVVRIVVDEFSQAAFTSNYRTVEAITELLRQGFSPVAAINKFIGKEAKTENKV